MAGGALFNILFNLAAIPFVGYYGPAVSMVLTEMLILAASFFMVSRSIALPPLNSYIRPAIAAVIMGVVLLVLWKLNIFILIAVAALSYLGALVFSGVITKSDISKVREALI
jgi:O-antigen/teichoic acid export membrane protein